MLRYAQALSDVRLYAYEVNDYKTVR